MLPVSMWLLAFDLLIGAAGDHALPSAVAPTSEHTTAPASETTSSQDSKVAIAKPPTSKPTKKSTDKAIRPPTETNLLKNLQEAQEHEVEMAKRAEALFLQLQKTFYSVRQNAHNKSSAVQAARLLTSTVDEVAAGPRKQLEAEIEHRLFELRNDVTNLVHNKPMITKEAMSNVQLKFTRVEAGIRALRELDEDLLTAMHRGYALAQQKEKKHHKASVKEVFHAAQAWKKAGRRTMEVQMDAGFSEQVYQRHYERVEESAETLMDKVEDLDDQIMDALEEIFGHIEHHVEVTMDENREASNVKYTEYEEALLQLQERIEDATMNAYSLRWAPTSLVAKQPVETVHAENDQVIQDASMMERAASLTKESKDESKAHAMKLLAALSTYTQVIVPTLNRTEAAKTAAHLINQAEQIVHRERSQSTREFEEQARSFDRASQHLSAADPIQAQEILATATANAESAAAVAYQLGRLDEQERHEARKVRKEARMAMLSKAKRLTNETVTAGRAWLRAARHNLKVQRAAGSEKAAAQEAALVNEEQAELFADQAEHLGETLEDRIRDHFEEVSESVESHLTELHRHRHQREQIVGDLGKMLTRFKTMVTSRAVHQSAQLNSTAASMATPTLEGAIVMESATSWFAFPALVLAFFSGGLVVCVVDHFRFRHRRRSTVHAPLLLG